MATNRTNRKRNKINEEKVEIRKKIELVLKAEEADVEAAAHTIAPDFDFDAECAELKAEEAMIEIKLEAEEKQEEETRYKIEKLIAAEGPALEEVARKMDPDFERDDYADVCCIEDFQWTVSSDKEETVDEVADIDKDEIIVEAVEEAETADEVVDVDKDEIIVETVEEIETADEVADVDKDEIIVETVEEIENADEVAVLDKEESSDKEENVDEVANVGKDETIVETVEEVETADEVAVLDKEESSDKTETVDEVANVDKDEIIVEAVEEVETADEVAVLDNEESADKTETADEVADIDKDEVIVETVEEVETADEVAVLDKEESSDKTETADETEAVEKPLPAALVSRSKYPKPVSERYRPKTGLGRYFLKDRHTIAMAAMLLMFMIAVIWQGLDYYIPETVNVTFKTIDETDKFQMQTRSRTVGEFLKEMEADGHKITSKDAISESDDRPIRDDMELVVAKAYKTKASIGGKDQSIYLIPGTVAEALAFNGIEYDDDDEISPGLKTKVSSTIKLKVDEVHYVEKDKKEVVEAQSKVILDPGIQSGVQETTEGYDGKCVYTYRTRYVNGKKIKTEKKLKKWIKKPQNHELRLGTSATGNSGEFMVARTFTANTTAYTAAAGARGSLGESVHVGTCAVDPSFVSYRSQMWIEGYGYAYANDCGGAVKGNVVDLYMSSHSACIQWGRRNVTAYVLTPVK